MIPEPSEIDTLLDECEARDGFFRSVDHKRFPGLTDAELDVVDIFADAHPGLGMRTFLANLAMRGGWSGRGAVDHISEQQKDKRLCFKINSLKRQIDRSWELPQPLHISRNGWCVGAKLYFCECLLAVRSGREMPQI